MTKARMLTVIATAQPRERHVVAIIGSKQQRQKHWQWWQQWLQQYLLAH
jgi:hypothetical protein